MESASLRQSWWQLTSIQIGGIICLPVIMIGQALNSNYGFWPAVIAIIIGNMLLALLGCVRILTCLDQRHTTLENATHYFGRASGKLLALAFIICLIGWFGIQLDVMSLSLYDSILSISGVTIPRILITLILGFLITFCAIGGIQMLNRFAQITIPLLIGTLAYALYTAFAQSSHFIPEPTLLPINFQALSLVIATAIALIADLPTFYRFARSAKEGILSIAILFLLVIPTIELLGVYIDYHTKGSNIVSMLSLSGGMIWHLWIAFFLLFAGWTTNNTNLYSASTCLGSLFTKLSHRWLTIVAGTAGTFLGCFDLLNNFATILNGMGTMMTSMTGVILTHYSATFLLKKATFTHQDQQWNMATWIAGTLYGIATLTHYVPSLSGSGMIDSFLLAMLITGLRLLLSQLYFTTSIRKKS